jgi:hypothetical protein
MGFLTRARTPLIVAALLFLLRPGTAAAQTPPDLVNLDREVSLRLAHVRDQGPVENVKRQQLSQAADLQQKSEKAIAAGDYKSARSDLLAAKTILDNLGD